nr:hypothetical protein Iba_chr06aCG4640 [Ipomoea batatas]
MFRKPFMSVLVTISGTGESAICQSSMGGLTQRNLFFPYIRNSLLQELEYGYTVATLMEGFLCYLQDTA